MEVSPPSLIRVIESRRMKWAERVERMGETEMFTQFFGKPERRDHLET
jgi:hypothetical protein